jgi:hypothetical protein
MRPRADEMVQSVIWTLDNYIVPDLTDPLAKSMARAMGNVLRIVAARILLEGPSLDEDNRELRQALRSAQALLERTASAREEPTLSDPARQIETALAKPNRAPEDYRTVASLIEEATGLRWALVRAIEALDENKAVLTGPEHERVRGEIHTYLRHQLEREATYTREALSGPWF